MPGVTLVKLGGSLITDKRREAHPRADVIERLAGEIAEARGRMAEGLLLGHGSGSFGHVAAAHHELGQGPIARTPESLAGVGFTQDQAARLHRLVVGALLRAGVPTFSWAPSSALIARAGRPVSGRLEPLLSALELGLVPVVYGDVVVDRGWGASIASTEAVLRYLVGRLRRRGFRVDRLLWLGETDGVYDREGRTIPRLDARSYRKVLKLVDAPAGTDVTGGMILRLQTARALARLGIESWLLNGRTPGLLAAVLAGGRSPGEEYLGTRFAADR